MTKESEAVEKLREALECDGGEHDSDRNLLKVSRRLLPTILAENQALRARVAEVENPWRPMNEAPRDGTRVVGATEYGAVIVWFDEDGWYSDFSAFPMRPGPTHWMPLPPIPSGDDNGTR